jgi:SAM-dependent methyltransferase
MAPTIKDYYILFKQLLTGFQTKKEFQIARRRDSDIASFLTPKSHLRILDLANGRLRPQYYLLKASGENVIGIDLANGSKSGWVDFLYRFARWLYFQHIPMNNFSKLADTLVCGDVSHLPFASDYFDLVTSVASFEHFLNVPAVVIELKRVLSPGGIAWIGIHLFTSPSGGHSLGFTEIPLRTIPKDIDPWDHLRKKKTPFSVPLNQWRLHQYLEIFSDNFEMLHHYCVTREGELFLTPEIEAELSEYNQDELTCRSYVIVARKS